MHHKKRVEETRVRISLYRLLTVEPRDLISSSRYTRLSEWICAFRNGRVRSDFFLSSRSWAWTCNHRFDSSPVVYERPARSVPRFALITAPVLTFLFTGRDAAITVNSIRIDITH